MKHVLLIAFVQIRPFTGRLLVHHFWLSPSLVLHRCYIRYICHSLKVERNKMIVSNHGLDKLVGHFVKMNYVSFFISGF